MDVITVRTLTPQMRILTIQLNFGSKVEIYDVKSSNSRAENHAFKFSCCYYCVAFGKLLSLSELYSFIQQLSLTNYLQSTQLHLPYP